MGEPRRQPAGSTIRRSRGLLRLLAVAVVMVAVAASAAATYGVTRPDRKPPTRPSELRATPVGSTAMSLSWRASRDASGPVRYAVSVEGQAVGATVEKKFLATGLACERTYDFEVRGFDRSGNYSAPAGVSATTEPCDMEPPSAPTGVVQLERTASSLTIAWAASTDDVGVVSYEFYRDGELVGETAQESHIFGGLSCARTYGLSVAARDAAGHASDRATVLMSTAECPDISPPSLPAGLAQTAASATSVTLAWESSSDDVGVVAYDVYRNGDALGSAAQTSVRIDGLSCETSYSVAVAARDRVGNRSAPASAVVAAAPCATRATTPPSAPQDQRVEPAATAVTMTWSPSTDDVGVTGYNVYLGGTAVATTTQTSYTYAGLECGTAYVVAVEARDAAGNLSNRAEATAPASTLPCNGDTTPPGQPAGVSLSAVTSTSVTLAWSAASDDVGVAGYGVYRDGASIADVGGGERSYVVTGLACGTSATFAVDAADAAGNGSAPVEVVAATAPCTDTEPPSMPGGLAATGSTESSVSIRWEPSTDNLGVTGYGVYLAGVRVADTPSPAFVAEKLACGRAYTVAVDAHDAAGNRSAQSSLVVSTATCAAAAAAAAEALPGTVPVFTTVNPPATPSVDQLPKRSSVSKDGVTWTFSQAVPVGQFITGDYYVVGPVTVTSISPAPANGRNGSVKNLPARDGVTGFDSRTEGNRYDARLRANPPVSLVPGDSLVSSISVETVGATKRVLYNTAADSPVKSVSILTSVSAPQPPDAFRPSYTGRGAPIFRSRNLKRELLPRLSAVPSTPTLGQFEGYFRRPWIDNLFFNFDSPIEYMPDYSREIARAVGMAGLLLTLDHTVEAKEPLLVYLVQYGIDLAGLVEAGHRGWPAFGGHGSGRKFPIVLAGTLLGEPSLQSPRGRYGEDEQTMSGQGWTGATALYAGHYGEGGSGEHGPYEHLRPRDWPSLMGEDYRRCCTSSAWIGEALASMLIEGLEAAWNSPVFFDYADRWMTEDDTQHLATIESETGKDYSAFPQGEAWDDFVTNMWTAYRDDAGGGGGGGGGADRTPPTQPTGFQRTGSTTTSIAVSWGAATDNVGVAGYAVYRDGTRLFTPAASARAYTYVALACGRSYTLELDAYDAAGNRSPKASLSASTGTCAGAGTRPPVLPGQSWDAACEAAAPGDVIPLAGGSHPSQSVSCRKAAPGVTFRPVAGATVVAGTSGAISNCVSLGGSSYVTVEGVRTTMYSRGGKTGQCGVALGRGSAHHLTLRDVDAGHIFIAADDVQVIGGDYGPTVDEVTLISPRTCDVSDDSCMPQRVLIDGAFFHDYRRDTRHMECISFYGGDDVTIRNSRFFNCAVFSIFVSGGAQLHFDRLLFENNVYERGSEGMSNHVKFSNHGATYKGVVMRNERFVGDDLYVASVSASDYRFQRISGPINVFNACSLCAPGTYRTGGTVAVIEGSDPPPPPASQCSDGVNNDPAEDFLIDLADPGCSGPTDNSELGNPATANLPPLACFTRTPPASVPGEPVVFNASCSSDPDGDTLTYSWDISPGGDGIYERSGPTTSYPYTSTGTKKARLRVDDGHGHAVGTEQTFLVVDPRQAETIRETVTQTITTTTTVTVPARTPSYPGFLADGEIADFDHLNQVNGGTFTAENGYYRSASGTNGYGRGVQPISFHGDGYQVWYGADVLLPADFYTRLTSWTDSPVRLINWQQYPGSKNNAGTAIAVWNGGASGDKRIGLATWRDDQIPSKQTHARGPVLTVSAWHRLDIYHRFSSTAPVSELWIDGALIERSTRPNYTWERPLIFSHFQCGHMPSGATNSVMHIDNCYFGPERLTSGRR